MLNLKVFVQWTFQIYDDIQVFQIFFSLAKIPVEMWKFVL